MNLNDFVMVRLTPLAHAKLAANHADIFKDHRNPPEYIAPKQRPDGWTEFSLWRLMQEFGPHMHMGMTRQLFVDNEVRLRNE